MLWKVNFESRLLRASLLTISKICAPTMLIGTLLLAGATNGLSEDAMNKVAMVFKGQDFSVQLPRRWNRVLTYKGIVPGVIRSAAHLSANQRQEIEKKVESITGKNIVFTEEIDSDLIGGFVIRVKDTVIDLSIKGQLEQLRHKLIHG